MFHYIEILALSVIISGLSSFVIITARRMGIINFLQGRVNNMLIYELLSCNFCIGFWLSLLFTILALALVPITWSMLLVPPIAAAFNNSLLK